MLAADQYALLDFGDGRKLEQFGGLRIDRPAPAAEREVIQAPALWRQATRFTRRDAQHGAWSGPALVSDEWTIQHGELRFELRLTPSGQIGLFPEQVANWDWIAAQAAAAGRPVSVLNLFAYTGASTLAAARAGAAVAHVDAARSAVAWARRNAERSSLAAAPIRWIVEDARKFVARELQRGRHYDGVVLDPPTYGHGPDSRAWQIDRDLRELLSGCAALLGRQGRFLLASCHSPGWDAPVLAGLLHDVMAKAGCRGAVEAAALELRAGERALPAGVAARWVRHADGG